MNRGGPDQQVVARPGRILQSDGHVALLSLSCFRTDHHAIRPANEWRVFYQGRRGEAWALWLASNFLLKDSCALSDQMSFVPAFPWRLFVLAVGNRDRANKNEIAIIVLGVTTKDLSHDMLPPELSRVYVTFFQSLSHTTLASIRVHSGSWPKTFSVCSRGPLRIER